MNKIDMSSGAGNNDIIHNVFKQAIKKVDVAKLSDYPNPLGLDGLRNQIAKVFWIDKNILITNSATEALYLIFSSMPDATIAIQSPSFFWVIRQLKQLNINYVVWENVEQLKKLSSTNHIDGIYVNSNCNTVDGQCLDECDKEEIISLWKNNGVQIIEDNPCDLLCFDGKLSKISDRLPNSVYVSSLSKIFLPWLRLGFLATSNAQIDTLKSAKITMNLSTSMLGQLVASYALEQDYIKKLTEHNHVKWLQFKEVLMDSGLRDFKDPKGWIFVKLDLPKDIDIEKLVKNVWKAWFLIEENKFYYADNKNRPYIRLNFISNDREVNKVAINVLAEEIHKFN